MGPAFMVVGKYMVVIRVTHPRGRPPEVGVSKSRFSSSSVGLANGHTLGGQFLCSSADTPHINSNPIILGQDHLTSKPENNSELQPLTTEPLNSFIVSGTSPYDGFSLLCGSVVIQGGPF